MQKRDISAKTAKDGRRKNRMMILRYALKDAMLAEDHKAIDRLMVQLDNLEFNKKRRLVAVQESA